MIMAEKEKAKKATPVSCQVITPDETFINPYSNLIMKSDTSEQLEPSEMVSDYLWLPKKYNQYGLKELVSHSAILPQCIKAYGSNIAGFGIGVRYNDEYSDVAEETEEMIAEYNRVTNIVKMLGAEMDTKEILENAIKLREEYGIAYIECIRNLEGNVVQIEYIKNVQSVEMTRPQGDFIEIQQTYGDEVVTRNRQFRKFRQTIAGKTVYFKEFGDTRIMDKHTGEYVKSLPIKDRANELMSFIVGNEDYGEVRWIGQVLPQDGARRAEVLNNNYFINGRHVPLMIVIRGGTLTEESSTRLKNYLAGVRGENAQHGYLILETENDSTQASFTEEKQPEIQIVPLASVLQQDELFQSYQDNARKKAQSAFLLPDLYVGYTTEFNRATAQTAMEVTEQQVFQTERASINWKLNNKLLKSYNFKYCEVYLKAPDITNPDDITKILNITERAGGLTPNQAKELTCKTLGKVSEDYPDEWGGIPLQYLKTSIAPTISSLEGSIEKAENNEDYDIVPILKSVKDALQELIREREDDVPSV